MIRPNFLFLAAISGLTGVAMGAFGAHGLKAILTPDMLAVYKTAVDYQMWHALGLALVAILYQQNTESEHLKWAGGFMFGGIVVFSGSLYLLSILNIKWLGMITPIGGLCFLLAWGSLAIFALKAKE
jgi:uncharacterized membrane protein YgdD (TMEM256/DUF423 family)